MPGNLSKYRSAAPIGGTMLFSDSDPLITLGDSSVWLRQGSFAVATAYPRASSVESLKAISFSTLAAASGFGVTLGNMATDGAGTIVVAHGQTAVQRSADNGATWATVDLSSATGALTVHRVYFLNGKFWALANSSTNLVAAESVTGAAGTWTQRTILTGTGDFTSSRASMDWSGTNFTVVCSNNNGNGVWTSPTGVTWTLRLGSALTINTTALPQVAASQTGGTVVLLSSDTTYRVSTDHGVNWGANLAPPVTPEGNFTVGNRFYMIGSVGGVAAIFTTLTPAVVSSWVRVELPYVAAYAFSHLGQSQQYRSSARDFVYLTNAVKSDVFRLDASGNVSSRRTDRLRQLGSANGMTYVDNGVILTLQANNTNLLGRAVTTWANPNAVSLGAVVESTTTNNRNTYVKVA